MSDTAAPFLNITVQHQPNDNWCWLEVAAAIAQFYDPRTRWTASALADAMYAQGCYATPQLAQCNAPRHLKDALVNCTHNLREPARDDPSNCMMTAEEIRAELKAGHPICMRVAWQTMPNGSPGHVFVVRGIHLDTNGVVILDISDPSSGNGGVRLSDLNGAYGRNNGRVDASYLTQPASQ
jgi:hypothetical protein